MVGRPRLLAATVITLALIGGVDSGLLTWDHQQAKLGEQSGLCAEGGGCDISRSSTWSRIPLPGRRPALPVAALGLGGYLVFAGLGLWWLLKPERRDAPRVLLGMSLLAVGYAVTLAAYSLMTSGTLCQYCAVLYAVNFGLLGATALGRGERWGAWFKGVWGSAVSTVGMVAVVGLILGTFGVYTVYAAPLAGRQADQMALMLEQARALPSTPRGAIAAEGRPGHGAADAPIHIIEFADYECPHCKLLYEVLHSIVAARPEQVRVSMLSFPLDMACNPAMKRAFHQNACLLARVAECAHEQGRWADLAPWLFEQAPAITAASARERVVAGGLDGAAYDACMASERPDVRIAADIKAGTDAGIRATPTFFVNGHLVEGGRPRPVVEAMIDAVAATP
jgi:protein-disulfide isomerase